MSRMWIVVTVLLVGVSLAAASNGPNVRQGARGSGVYPVAGKSPSTSRFLPDRIIVKLRRPTPSPGAAFGVSGLDQLANQMGAARIERKFPQHAAGTAGAVDLSLFFQVTFAGPVDAFAMAEKFSRRPEVEYAEPLFVYDVENEATFLPNDTEYSKQWSLPKVKADSAWSVSQGDTSIVIAIIDTGVEWPHPDLAANIWLNPGENGTDGSGFDKRTNGIDDDGNGFVDDWHGWDFVGATITSPLEDNDPRPVSSFNSHGTHVAGIASAVTNNTTGVASIGFKCKLMALKTAAENESNPSIYFWTDALVYAADNGAKVVNCSFGGSGASLFEQDMVNYATGKGCVIVAAAGNGSPFSVPFYPAAYDNVISVAATNRNDALATYTHYGSWIDLAAPGGDDPVANVSMILSTLPPNLYGLSSGTSMASPLVAGLAGLVWTQFPSYTPVQIGEQVRTTCDNIDAQNAGYVGLYGKGRINAYRALTANFPSVRVVDAVTSDSVYGNGNTLLEPNEDFTVLCTFKNFLAATGPGTGVTMTTTDPYLQIVNGSYPMGALATGATASNSGSLFRVHILSNAPPLHTAYLRVNIADGGYQDFQLLPVLLNPLFATHNANNVVFTVSNFGSLGYQDYSVNPPTGIAYGSGFQFPKGAPSSLYHASSIFGTDANHVADNIYGNTTDSSAVDLKNAANGAFSFAAQAGAAQTFACAFTDSGIALSANRLGIRVAQRSYAYTTVADSDYVLLRYDVRNMSGAALNNLYVGMFADWDVGDYSTNLLGYDSSRRLGYMWDSNGSNYYGICLVYPSAAASFRAINNATYVYNGFDEANKWSFLSSGFGVTQGATPDDWSMMLSAGPTALVAGDSTTVGFAFIGGTSLANLQANADAAIAKWPVVLDAAGDAPGAVPTVFALHQNYPNPFNPSTEMRYDLPVAGNVRLAVYDVMGREVGLLYDGFRSAGSYTATFSSSGVSSGVYFARLTAVPTGGGSAVSGPLVETRKLLLLK